MATIQLGFGFDIGDFDLSSLSGKAPVVISPSLVRVTSSDGVIHDFSGSNFTQSGATVTGSISGYAETVQGHVVLNATGLSLSASAVLPLVADGDTDGFLAAVTGGADNVTGTGLGDVFRTGAGDDVVSGGGGLDVFDGGAGVDTVSLHGSRASYSIDGDLSRLTVNDLRAGAPDGTEILFNFERAQFSDGALDLTKIDAAAVASYSAILRTTAGAMGLGLQVGNGLLSAQTAVQADIVAAENTSSVATLSYEFFTGKAPSAAGMDFLVSPTGPNANNLNAPYYQSFSLENRYINFAVNLGKVGEGNAAFTAKYGNLSLFEATRTAYATIFGEAPSDAKLHAILDPTTVLNGVTFTRSDYFAYYGQDGANGIGTKAAMVGYLLAEAEKADVGVYAKSNDAFLTDVGLHNAPFGVDLVGVYNQPGFVFHPG